MAVRGSNFAKMAVVVLVMSGMCVAMADKLTVVCEQGKKVCFRDMLGERSSYKFKYTVLEKDESKDSEQSDNKTARKDVHKDANVVITLKDIITDSYLITSRSMTNTSSVYLKNGASLYDFCVENNRDSQIRVKFEISSGLDINDFANLPFHVQTRLT